MYTIIKDTSCNEYGLMQMEPVIKTFNEVGKHFGNSPVKKAKLGEIASMKMPVIRFYDSENKLIENDFAYYTSENARKRYQIIKDIKKKKEFFEFIKKHERNKYKN